MVRRYALASRPDDERDAPLVTLIVRDELSVQIRVLAHGG